MNQPHARQAIRSMAEAQARQSRHPINQILVSDFMSTRGITRERQESGMRILAIDPGPELSAWLVYDMPSVPRVWGKIPNEEILERIDETAARQLAIEMVASYGMAVGAEVFETCVWSGRFIERWLLGRPEPRPHPCRVYRKDVKLHLCGSARAKDPNVRQALIDQYGPGRERAIGRKASPGPLYGLSGDCWSALAVAVTAAETMLEAAA